MSRVIKTLAFRDVKKMDERLFVVLQHPRIDYFLTLHTLENFDDLRVPGDPDIPSSIN